MGPFPPWAWFAIASAALGVLLWAAGYDLRIRSVFLTAIVAFAALVSDGYYSPYYKIHLASYFEAGGTKPTHYSVFVDKLRIQDAIDFDQDLEKTAIGPWVPYYMLPYKLRPAPARVLVLGGGSGNDTAIALKPGAKHARRSRSIPCSSTSVTCCIRSDPTPIPASNT